MLRKSYDTRLKYLAREGLLTETYQPKPNHTEFLEINLQILTISAINLFELAHVAPFKKHLVIFFLKPSQYLLALFALLLIKLRNDIANLPLHF